jgi:hypothetical protein
MSVRPSAMTGIRARTARLVLGGLAVLPFAGKPTPRLLDDVTLAKNAKASIVFITLDGERQNNGQKEKRTATGFVIDQAGHLITVNHIFTDDAGGEFFYRYELRGVFGGGTTGGDQPRELEVIKRDESADLALLKLKERPTGMTLTPVVTCLEEPESGTRLVGFGFPKNKGFANAEGSFNNPSGKAGAWQVTMDAGLGMSGGPVYDKTGRVRAVVKGGVPGEAETTSVIPIQYAESFAVKAKSGCGAGPAWWKRPVGYGSVTAAVVGAGTAAYYLSRDTDVTFQNARFDPAEVQCRAGSSGTALPFTILIDFDATRSGESISGATLTMRVEETFQPGETVGTEAGFPTTSVTPTELGRGPGTVRLNSELKCSNVDGTDKVTNRWRGSVSIIHSAGTAATLQTSNLLAVRNVSTR